MSHLKNKVQVKQWMEDSVVKRQIEDEILQEQLEKPWKTDFVVVLL